MVKRYIIKNILVNCLVKLFIYFMVLLVHYCGYISTVRRCFAVRHFGMKPNQKIYLTWCSLEVFGHISIKIYWSLDICGYHVDGQSMFTLKESFLRALLSYRSQKDRLNYLKIIGDEICNLIQLTKDD